MKPEDQEPTAADAAAEREALRALQRVPVPEAPAIVRARARRAFLSGVGGEQATRTLAPEPLRSGRVVVPLNPRRRNRLAPIAFAAAVVLVLLGYGAQAPHPWRLTDVHDPFGDLAGRTDRSVGSVLQAGPLQTPEFGQFEFSLGNDLRLRLAPCSGIVLPPAPRRWNPDDLTIEVSHGELFGSTGGARLPVPIEVVTNVLSARITGTTFAVLRIPDATCVCLLEGSVRISPRVGDAGAIDVPVGNKVLIYNDGRDHEVVPIDDMERSKLQMLYDATAATRGQVP